MCRDAHSVNYVFSVSAIFEGADYSICYLSPFES